VEAVIALVLNYQPANLIQPLNPYIYYLLWHLRPFFLPSSPYLLLILGICTSISLLPDLLTNILPDLLNWVEIRRLR
jgi:hypothetical protein